MKVYGYEYETYVKMREDIQLAMGIIRDYIYIIKCDKLYLVSKKDVSMLEIENYSYVGKMLGHDVYIEPILLRSD